MHRYALATLLLLATASCTTAPAPDPVVAPPASADSRYPEALRTAIITKCTGGGAPAALCECLVVRMESSIPAEDLASAAVSDEMAAGWASECEKEVGTTLTPRTPLPPAVREGVMRECIPKIGEAACECVMDQIQATYSLEDVLGGRLSPQVMEKWEAECKAASAPAADPVRAAWVRNCKGSIPFPQSCDCIYGRLATQFSERQITEGDMPRDAVNGHVKACVAADKSAVAGEPWPPAAQKAFMDNCPSNYTKAACQCGLEKTQKRYAVTDLFNGSVQDDVLEAFLNECAAR